MGSVFVTTLEDGRIRTALVHARHLALTGNLTAMAAAARSWSLAYLCIYYLPGKFGLVYPAFGPAAEFSVGWMSHTLLRNVLATLIICGGWDWFLYFSPLGQAPQVQDEP